MSDRAIGACLLSLWQAGDKLLPVVSMQLRHAWRDLATTDFEEARVFKRPADVFAGRESGIADSMANLRLELEGTLISMCDGIDLIGAALVQTAADYEQVDQGAYELFDKILKPAGQ